MDGAIADKASMMKRMPHGLWAACFVLVLGCHHAERALEHTALRPGEKGSERSTEKGRGSAEVSSDRLTPTTVKTGLDADSIVPWKVVAKRWKNKALLFTEVGSDGSRRRVCLRGDFESNSCGVALWNEGPDTPPGSPTSVKGEKSEVRVCELNLSPDNAYVSVNCFLVGSDENCGVVNPVLSFFAVESIGGLETEILGRDANQKLEIGDTFPASQCPP